MKRWVFIGLTTAAVLVPTPALADHDYDCDWRGDCSGQEYDQWNSEQRNHNGRERGAFSPGPFDDSPVDAFNGICMPGATCHYDGDRQREQQPR